MSLAAGQSLSFYQILGPLGAGAMGEVYRAMDTRLDREVAIKVLPEHFAEDEERLRRFEREAKSLASLRLLVLRDGADAGRREWKVITRWERLLDR